MPHCKYIITLLILSSLTNCREDIDLKLEESEPQLVINSVVSYTNASLRRGDGSIKIETLIDFSADLSLTKSYYEDPSTSKYVNDAKVYVNAEYKNSTVKHELKFVTSSDGAYYFSPNAALPNYTINYDARYTLEIHYKGQIYVSSKEKLIRTPVIKNVISKQVENPFRVGEKSIEVEVYFDDDTTSENYYILDIPSLGNYLNNDKLYDGKSQYVFKVIEPTTSTNPTGDFKLSAIDSKYYRYLKIIESQSGSSSGPPNNTAKAPVRGNVYNTTNKDYFPLGYFNVREINFYDKK